MDQQELEKQLEQQRLKLAEMARFPEMNPGPVVRMSLKGKILLCNSAAVTVFGEDLVGRNWITTCPGLQPATWNDMLVPGKVFSFETEIGERIFSFNHRFDPQSNLVFAYGNDITQNKLNEKKLEEQRAAIAEIARFPDMNPGPVLRMSLDGDIRLSNKAAEQLFGENITGDNWVTVCPRMSKETWSNILESEKVFAFETSVNDQEFVFNHRMDRHTNLVFVFGTDISAQKKAEKQLRHAEKMASLGELTAGIAHEIQNPLNFVNNFSELNSELMTELTDELVTGNISEATSIAANVKANNEKINFHGKRADSIVKNMLQHSKSGTGQKEPTDINSLADEFLRLAYHGLRAMDNSFYSRIETSFDDSIGKVLLIPQDIGRVLLNLVNNAFYAASEKHKRISADQPGSFEPLVTVISEKKGNKISITVNDNGDGIPDKNLDKIFQPFFTTKPTGSGTGLGLSLSYDIVKAHGGDLRVETKAGEHTSFIIELPLER